MHEKMTYTNGKGESVAFGMGHFYADQSDIHDYAWSATIRNRNVSFRRDERQYEIPAHVFCGSEAEGIAMRNRMHDIFEADISNSTPGVIEVGQSSMECYIIGTSKERYNVSSKVMDIKLSVLSVNPVWVTKSEHVIMKTENGEPYPYLDFPYGYPYDLSMNPPKKTIDNAFRNPASFTMRMYGPCTDPRIVIAGNEYSCRCSVPDGGFLFVDSREGKKKCVVIDAGGSVANVFDMRIKGRPGSGFYMFEAIPSGLSDVECTLQLVDITLYDERSEPLWT